MISVIYDLIAKEDRKYHEQSCVLENWYFSNIF